MWGHGITSQGDRTGRTTVTEPCSLSAHYSRNVSHSLWQLQGAAIAAVGLYWGGGGGAGGFQAMPIVGYLLGTQVAGNSPGCM